MFVSNMFKVDVSHVIVRVITCTLKKLSFSNVCKLLFYMF